MSPLERHFGRPPSSIARVTRFALATGLRQANVLGLKWPDVDMDRRTAWVHADEAKGGEAIGVPLNDDAMAVLSEEKGKHPDRVFTYKGRPLGQVNTRPSKALRNSARALAISTSPGSFSRSSSGNCGACNRRFKLGVVSRRTQPTGRSMRNSFVPGPASVRQAARGSPC